MTVMPQEVFKLYGLDGDYQVHIDGVPRPLESLDNPTLGALSDLWTEVRARYAVNGGGNIGALRILAELEREHADGICCGLIIASDRQERHFKDAASVVRQLLDGEAMLDGVPFDIAKAFPVTRKA